MEYAVLGLGICLGLIVVAIGIMAVAWSILCIKDMFLKS